jgi:hypothetical protein
MGLFSRFCVQALRFSTHSASKTRANALAEALRRRFQPKTPDFIDVLPGIPCKTGKSRVLAPPSLW